MSISGLHVTLVSGSRRLAGRVRLAARPRAGAAPAGAQGGRGRGDRRRARLHAHRRLRRAGAAHLLDGDDRRRRRCGAGDRVAGAHARARPRGDRAALDPWAMLAPRAAGFPSARCCSSSTARSAGARQEAPSRNGDGCHGRSRSASRPRRCCSLGQVSVAGPIANAWRSRWCRSVVTPLALLAAILPLDVPAAPSAWLVEWLLQFLEWCATLPGAQWQQHVPPLWTVARSRSPARAWLLAPRGVLLAARAVSRSWRRRSASLRRRAAAPGEVWITALDVGQGLAVLARTTHAHAALRRRAGVGGGRRQRLARGGAGDARRGDSNASDLPRPQPRGQRPHRRRASACSRPGGRRAWRRRSGPAIRCAAWSPRRGALRRGRGSGNGTACASSS